MGRDVVGEDGGLPHLEDVASLVRPTHLRAVFFYAATVQADGLGRIHLLGHYNTADGLF